jgi:hypothetical protein
MMLDYFDIPRGNIDTVSMLPCDNIQLRNDDNDENSCVLRMMYTCSFKQYYNVVNNQKLPKLCMNEKVRHLRFDTSIDGTSRLASLRP